MLSFDGECDRVVGTVADWLREEARSREAGKVRSGSVVSLGHSLLTGLCQGALSLEHSALDALVHA